MNEKHAKLLEIAKEAASNVHGDTSVSQQQTYDSLCDLASHVDSLVDAVQADLDQAGE